MVLRKITVDNSVRYIPISENTKERDIKPKKIKAGSLARKQKNISQYKKKLKNVAEVDLDYLQNSICTIIIKIITLFIQEH